MTSYVVADHSSKLREIVSRLSGIEPTEIIIEYSNVRNVFYITVPIDNAEFERLSSIRHGLLDELDCHSPHWCLKGVSIE